jgi:hypothetical protein
LIISAVKDGIFSFFVFRAGIPGRQVMDQDGFPQFFENAGLAGVILRG